MKSFTLSALLLAAKAEYVSEGKKCDYDGENDGGWSFSVVYPDGDEGLDDCKETCLEKAAEIEENVDFCCMHQQYDPDTQACRIIYKTDEAGDTENDCMIEVDDTSYNAWRYQSEGVWMDEPVPEPEEEPEQEPEEEEEEELSVRVATAALATATMAFMAL